MVAVFVGMFPRITNSRATNPAESVPSNKQSILLFSKLENETSSLLPLGLTDSIILRKIRNKKLY